MNRIIFIIASAVLAIVAGCSDRHAAVVLPRAAAVMDSVPDSALVWLESIDGRRLHGAQRAEHALLLTQARYKCYVPQASDSLIGIAVDYYSDRADEYGDQLVKALYYKAEIHNEAGDRTHSLLTAMQAEKAPGFGSDPEFAARVYDLMAELYRQSYDMASELKYARLAAEYYSKSALKYNYLCMLIDQGIIEANRLNYRQSISKLDSVMPLCIEYGDSALIAECVSAYLMPLAMLKDYDGLAEKLDELKHFGSTYKPDILDYKCMLIFDISKNDYVAAAREIDTAQSMVKTAAHNHTLHSMRMILCKSLHDYENAVKLQDSLISYQNHEVLKALQHELNSMHRDFYYTQAENERARKQLAYTHLIVLIIVFLLCSVIVAWYIYERRHRYQRELNAQIAAIRQMELELKNVSANRGELSEKLHGLLSSHFSTLNMLCTHYYDIEDDNDRIRLSTYKKIKSETGKMSSGKSLDHIIDVVNNCRENIVDELRMQYQDLGPDDLKIIVLLWAGLSPKSISFLTGISTNTIYSKRRRWKSKFTELPSPYDTKFIEAFGQTAE